MGQRMSRRGVLRAAALALALRPATSSAAESALERLLGSRRMVRRFKPHPVSTATVRRLLAAAVRAPSAGHTQPWSFVVVRDRERRVELGRAAHRQMFVAEAPVVIVACVDESCPKARYGERGERYGVIDTAFASMCLLLAVVEAGLGACFVGAFEDADVARLLRLPEHVRPLAVIPIGYPAESPSRMRLRPLRDVVHRERW
ncbi:MAG: nitroreductase family protein [Candidatus Binatia bacterium]